MATSEKIPRPRLAAKEKVRRDESVIADRARGFGWSTVAARNGISVRQCQNIWKAREEYTSFEVADSREELRDEITFLDAAIEEYATLADTTPNDSIKLGAIKARVDAQAKRLELKRVCGLLPWDLRLALVADVARAYGEAIANIFRKHDVPEAVYEDVKAFVAGLHNGSTATPRRQTRGSMLGRRGQ